MNARLALIVLLVLSIIPLLDLLNPGLPLTHDGKDHVARIASFYRNLEEGVLIPRWGANLNWGYGHPVLMFLYPLPSYLASVIHFLGFSFVDSVKLVFALSFILSGLTAFLFLKRLVSIPSALIGSILYLYAPYRFVDLYVRGAIGEHVAFIFPPLIAYYMLSLAKENKAYLLPLAGLSLAGLILSHNAISIMILPFLGVYGLYLLGKSKEKKVLFIRFAIMAVTGFLLSAFFWVPAFFEGKYTLRDIVTQLDFKTRLYPITDFLYSPWGYGVSGNFSLQIGILHIILSLFSLLLGIYLFIKKKSLYSLWMVSLFVITLIIVMIMTPVSLPLWESVSLLQKFQFPWRLLTLVVIGTALMGVMVSNSLRRKDQVFLLGVVIAVVLLQPQFWQRQASLHHPESYYAGIYDSTTDTGESSPLWSTRFMEKRFAKPIELIGGEGSVRELKRTSTHHQYHVTADNTNQYVENTVYFPGWEVYIDGKKTDVVYQNELHRGLLTFYVPQGEHRVDVTFSDTRLRSMANTMSLLGFMLLPVVLLIGKKKIFSSFIQYKKHE